MEAGAVIVLEDDARPANVFADYARALSALEERDRVPVAVVDEYTCTKIVDAMGGNGRFVFPVAGEPEPVALPVYAVGMTVNRRHRQWIDYLRRGLSLFLAADTPYLATLYEELWRTLKGELARSYRQAGKEDCMRLAQEAANQILGIGAAVTAPDWQPIVDAATILVRRTADSPAAPRPSAAG